MATSPDITLPDRLSLREFVARSDCRHLAGCDWLLSTVGTSPATTCQAIAALTPKRVTLLHSSDTLPQAEAIREAYRAEVPLIELAWVVETDVNSIASLVRARPSGVVVVDITGGTKVMSAAAFHLADHIGAKVVYSQGEFDTATRRPKPNTERLVRLSLAESIRVERQLDEAFRLLARGQFDAAIERLSPVLPAQPRAADAALVLSFARLWAALLALDRSRLRTELGGSDVEQIHLVTAERRFGADLPAILAHLEALAHFSSDDSRGMCVALALIAEVHTSAGRADFAAMLWYRLIECGLEVMLREALPNLRQGNVDWQSLSQTRPTAIAGFHAEGRTAWGQDYREDLPLRLNLTDRLRLLRAIGSTSLAGAAFDVRKVSQLADARNNSILAHGTTSISAEATKGIRKTALLMLDALARGPSTAPPRAGERTRAPNAGEWLASISIGAMVEALRRAIACDGAIRG